MDENQKDKEFSQWFSTYGVITAERILGTYQIIIPQSELLVAIKSNCSFYHKLLQVPLKNVLNGIVFQQANDYHIYAQKLFIDYLLSDENAKDEEAQGALTRESLEEERKKLVALGEDFHHKQLEHDALIASSQTYLIRQAKEWKLGLESTIKLINDTLKHHNFDIKKSQVRQAVNHALIYCDMVHSQSQDNKYFFIDKMSELIKVSMTTEIKEQLVSDVSGLVKNTMNFYMAVGDFSDRVLIMSEEAKSYRSQFYETILRVNELLKSLPDYRINPEQDAINREPLYFDKSIGGK